MAASVAVSALRWPNWAKEKKTHQRNRPIKSSSECTTFSGADLHCDRYHHGKEARVQQLQLYTEPAMKCVLVSQNENVQQMTACQQGKHWSIISPLNCYLSLNCSLLTVKCPSVLAGSTPPPPLMSEQVQCTTTNLKYTRLSVFL